MVGKGDDERCSRHSFVTNTFFSRLPSFAANFISHSCYDVSCLFVFRGSEMGEGCSGRV